MNRIINCTRVRRNECLIVVLLPETKIFFNLSASADLKSKIMKHSIGKRNTMLSVSALGAALLLTAASVNYNKSADEKIVRCATPEANKPCIMKTIFGLENTEPEISATVVTPNSIVEASLKKGLEWIKEAQGNDGGWGAGTHARQDIKDPHAVPSDPATTALVGMALLRNGTTLKNGDFSTQLKKANEFLMEAVEHCPDNQPYITTLTNTQPQTKLGRNIDVILTAQYFTNLLRYEIGDAQLKKRIEQSLDKCVARIQKGQDADGSWKDGGWAPVLQSALANNALETAKGIGRKVDNEVLDRSRKYQNSNFDVQTNSALTGKSAGVMLYSLSSTTRASAEDAKKAKDIIQKANQDGMLQEVVVTANNLRKAGISAPRAQELETAYKINEASRKQALKDEVMTGYGNNGGEEFISYLMTGESMIMQDGNDWKKWYDKMESTLLKIQNNDGSWNGHHCITSPVFCTATCLLILSINKDMQFSMHLK